MLNYGLTVLYALFLWWFSTGVILYLDKRPRWTYRWSLLGATALMLLSLIALYWLREETTVLSAFIGFTAGVLIWAWMEMSYFMGLVTGPRKQPCPSQCSSWRRFWLAIQTSLYHELSIVAAGVLLIGMNWGAANQVGTWTFVILWCMRWSAKMNLFFGVPNLNEDWLPEHIRFLTSYLSKRPINLFFPISVSAATILMVLLVEIALEFPPESFSAIALMLIATLLALAILEHWLLVLPLADAALWRWALPSERTASSKSRTVKTPNPGKPLSNGVSP